MGLYSKYLLPRLIHLSMRQAQLRPYRARVAAGARGRVLEIGIGSGLNLALYGSAVEEVIGIDSSAEMLALAKSAVVARSLQGKLKLLAQPAEKLPLEGGTIDTVVVTWALCSIPDPAAALAEARRLLKSGGQLRFVEHGLSRDPAVRNWQNLLTPLWRRCGGGCHLNRKTDDLIRAAGFTLTELSTGYAPGPRPMAYMYEGCAEP